MGRDLEALKEAFSAFNETSERLEEFYQRLESRTSQLMSEIEERGAQERDLRLESMAWMVMKIVHDIRNPLGSIELISSLLRKEFHQDPDRRRLLDHIVQGVKNIDNILSNLLHFTRLPRPRCKTVNIKNLVEISLDVVSYMIEKKRIRVLQNISHDLQLSCDETLMKQVFVNLFLNSLQAMTTGGRLSIEVVEKEDGAGIEVLIEDSGCGILPEHMDRIFDPFFTTKEKGTGLGLTIVHNIVKVHGGEIRVHSKPGEGTLFILEIPDGLVPRQRQLPECEGDDL